MKRNCYYIILLISLLSVAGTADAQTLGDYRSAASGNWNAASSWERFDGSSFVAAPNAPSASDGEIKIRNIHTITANTNITADQVEVQTGGQLDLPFSSSAFELADGAGDDLVVNGTLTVRATINGTGNVLVNNTMSYVSDTIRTPMVVSTTGTLSFTTYSFRFFGTLTNNGTLDWQDGTMTISGAITNNGTFTVSGSNILHNNAPLNSGSGSIINNGIFIKTDPANTIGTTLFVPFINQASGIIEGTGTIAFQNSFSNSGTVAPGGSPGILSVKGGSPLRANGKLSIEFLNTSGPGTGHDQLQVNGHAGMVISGTLIVTELGSIPCGDYVFITSNQTISGNFASVTAPAGYSVIVNPNTVVLRKSLLSFQDLDGDGFGNPAVSSPACPSPTGFVANNQDCNDSNANIRPGAAEVCNGLDDDCNGQIDEGVKTTFFADADGDGFGNIASSLQACTAPTGFVTNNTDCNDNNAAVNPGAAEPCNGIDDDCNGQVDANCCFQPAQPGAITTSGGSAAVCPGEIRTYSVAAVSGASSYNWTSPTGSAITSGVGTPTITVEYQAGFTAAGTLSVTAVSCATSMSRTLTINRNVPAIPGAITGNVTSACPFTSQTYSVPAVAGITYTWTAPAQAIITAFPAGNSVTIFFGGSFTSGTLSVTAGNGCGTSAAQSVSVLSLPTAPGTITGPTSAVCANSSKSYSVTTQGGFTYTWTAPAGATISSGQGTGSVTVAFGSSFTSGTLSVKANNTCGSSANSSLSILSKPFQPGGITGQATLVCAGTTKSYSITAVAGSIYNWTAPANASIASGQGTSAVTVSYGAAFTSGTLSVVASNACGNSPARTLSIASVPAIPSAITGQSTAVCANTTKSYSVTVISGLTYTWTAPAGATISSGQGTGSVTVAYGSSFISGTLSVKANNACGSSASSSLSILSVPAQPGTITGPVNGVCAGTTFSYSVPAVSGVTYNWTAPSNASIISGQGTNAVTVSFNSSFLVGVLSVTASNSCGTSVLRSTTIRETIDIGPITGQASGLCGTSSVTYTATTVTVPNVSFAWTVFSGASIVSGQGTNSIVVNFPTGTFSGNISVIASNSCNSSPSRSLAVTSVPATPGFISGPATVCSNSSGHAYSTNPVSGASTYTWTGPAGSQLTAGGSSGNGTLTTTFTSVTVSYGTVTSTSQISVRANNTCGNSSLRTLTLTPCSGPRLRAEEGLTSVEVYPNPAHERVNISFTTAAETSYTLLLTDMLGKTALTQTHRAAPGRSTAELPVAALAKGMYLLTLVNSFGELDYQRLAIE